jgi:hypothetical protein
LTNSPPNRGYDGRSVSPPNPYEGKRDTRNSAAQMDPSRSAPGFHCPPALDVGNRSEDEDAMPLGGPIISPCHWDHMRLAQKSGISPLNAAALGCREYHGYQRGYYLLTADIIFKCGYKDQNPSILIWPALPTTPFKFLFHMAEETYCDFNVSDGLPQPLLQDCVTRVVGLMRVCGLELNSDLSVMVSRTKGVVDAIDNLSLIDGGANIRITGILNLLVEVETIAPLPILVATTAVRSPWTIVAPSVGSYH